MYAVWDELKSTVWNCNSVCRHLWRFYARTVHVDTQRGVIVDMVLSKSIATFVIWPSWICQFLQLSIANHFSSRHFHCPVLEEIDEVIDLKLNSLEWPSVTQASPMARLSWTTHNFALGFEVVQSFHPFHGLSRSKTTMHTNQAASANRWCCPCDNLHETRLCHSLFKVSASFHSAICLLMSCTILKCFLRHDSKSDEGYTRLSMSTPNLHEVTIPGSITSLVFGTKPPWDGDFFSISLASEVLGWIE